MITPVFEIVTRYAHAPERPVTERYTWGQLRLAFAPSAWFMFLASEAVYYDLPFCASFALGSISMEIRKLPEWGVA